MRSSGTALLLAAVLLAGCGGGKKAPKPNGEASKPAAQVLVDAKRAAGEASSVRLTGNVTENGQAVSLDLTLVRGVGGKGKVSIGGLGFSLVTLGRKAYVKGSDAFYTHFAGATAAQLLHGRWVEGSATSGKLAQLARLASIDALYRLVAAHGAIVNEGATTYRGQQVVAIRDRTKHDTLYVAGTGAPYPLAAVGSGAAKGTVTFRDWNAKVSVAAPKGAIDLSALGTG